LILGSVSTRGNVLSQERGTGREREIFVEAETTILNWERANYFYLERGRFSEHTQC
jgi:hypothetical protein